jgi:hypothetical protein
MVGKWLSPSHKPGYSVVEVDVYADRMCEKMSPLPRGFASRLAGGCGLLVLLGLIRWPDGRGLARRFLGRQVPLPPYEMVVWGLRPS